MKKKLRITQIKSTIGRDPKQRRVVKGLGLRGLGKSVVRDNSPAVRGMVKKVIHLLKIEEIDG
jgi:large subunit ribosomal protein L30